MNALTRYFHAKMIAALPRQFSTGPDSAFSILLLAVARGIAVLAMWHSILFMLVGLWMLLDGLQVLL